MTTPVGTQNSAAGPTRDAVASPAASTRSGVPHGATQNDGFPIPRARFLPALLEWLNRRLVPAGTVALADTSLFENGLIDSIRILDLIAWTERAAGITIADRMIRMDHFRTARTIADTFSAGGIDVDR